MLASFGLSACEVHQASPVLYWGEVPRAKELPKLKSLGIKSIVNLRTNSLPKKSEIAHQLGLKVFHIKTGVFLTPEAPEIKQFLEILCNPDNQPVFVCCTLGTDRTGYYLAVYRMAVEGWTIEQAYAEMNQHGLKHWWPTFTQYDDSLRSNEAFIRSFASKLACSSCLESTPRAQLDTSTIGKGIEDPRAQFGGQPQQEHAAPVDSRL
jgi:protein tyrosine phosphatase (PTP) superfamily phosphohydrolase (DUF442 family)